MFFSQGAIAIFTKLGGVDVVANLVLAVGGKWPVFIMFNIVVLILGMFLPWMIILIMIVPISQAIIPVVGFDPLWFALMMCVNLQMSFMTPPYAMSIFVLKGAMDVSYPQCGVTTNDIIMGTLPYIGLVILGEVLMCVFPQIITWLPAK